MGTWSTNTNLSASFTYIAQGSCAYNGKIYIIGGYNDTDHARDEVYEYDPSGDSYTALSSLGTARYGAAVGIKGSVIYVAGGYTNAGKTNSVEKYDISSPGAGWSSLANMPIADHALCGDIYGDDFYVFGSGTDDVLKYDISENSWSKPNTGGGIGIYGMARTVGDYIWVIGGGTDKKDIKKWNPSTDAWVGGSYTAPTNDVYFPASGVHGTKIYIAGGAGPLAKFVSYDTSTDTWDDTLPDITTARYGAAGDVADDNFYVIGGTAAAYSNKNESYDLPSSASTNPGGDINWAHTKIRG